MPQKRVRIQLQEGFINTHSTIVEADDGKSVTVKEVQRGLKELYDTTIRDAYWYPMNDTIARRNYRRAIIVMSRKLKNYPPGGVGREGNFDREEWSNNKGREFRLDVENFGGTNLSEIGSRSSKQR